MTRERRILDLKINPISRIVGGLELNLSIENNIIQGARIQSTINRGIEEILKDKDALDSIQISQRVCGLCSTPQALAAARLIESTTEMEIPVNARLIRNLLLAAHHIQTHIESFYLYILPDYLDYDSIITYSGNNSNLISLREKMIQYKLRRGQAQNVIIKKDQFHVSDSLFGLTLFENTLMALKIRQELNRFSAILGGRMPHVHTIIPGGVTVQLAIDDISRMNSLLRKTADFISRQFMNDLYSLCLGPWLPLGQLGVGASYRNFLSVGEYALDSDFQEKLFNHGVIFDGKIAEVPILQRDEIKAGGQGNASPLYKDQPMETGPLARLLVRGESKLLKIIKEYNLKLGLVSRYLSKGFESELLILKMEEWLEELIENNKAGNMTIIFPINDKIKGKGKGLVETPRGSLVHQAQFDGGKVLKYFIATPTNWNFSTTGYENKPGIIEKALMGLEVTSPDDLINTFRVIRSLDPCGNCLSH